MNQTTKTDDFTAIIGRYTIDLKEAGHAAGIVMMLASGVVWLYFNGGQRHLSAMEGIIAIASSAAAGWYLVHRVLRTVIVDRECIVGTGPLGVFRQEVRIEDIQGIQVGGTSRGVNIDIQVDGKTIRLIANRRFHRRIVEMIGRMAAR